MSHNIEHYVYPENVDKKRVQKELDNYVAHEDWQEGCTGLFHDIRWLNHEPYENREAAERAIRLMDRSNYDQLAVRYYAATLQKSAKLDQLREKEQECYKEYAKRSESLYPKSLTSAYLGCKACGSRLSVKHLSSNACPVCRKDLRPEYLLTGIASAKKRWESAKAKTAEYIDKTAKKKVVWLVKIEYHT